MPDNLDAWLKTLEDNDDLIDDLDLLAPRGLDDAFAGPHDASSPYDAWDEAAFDD